MTNAQKSYNVLKKDNLDSRKLEVISYGFHNNYMAEDKKAEIKATKKKLEVVLGILCKDITFPYDVMKKMNKATDSILQYADSGINISSCKSNKIFPTNENIEKQNRLFSTKKKWFSAPTKLEKGTTTQVENINKCPEKYWKCSEHSQIIWSLVY